VCYRLTELALSAACFEFCSNPACLFMPHLGASTGEAEEVSAAMAADEIRDYLEHGIIRNSVNFPETALKRKGEGVARLTIVNRNIPGVLGEITTLIGKQNVNILQTVNTSRDDVAYNVVDLGDKPEDIEALQDAISNVEGVLSSRFITGQPDMYYRTTA
jgi:D-3-phosphoglycerate dehydrogenase